MSGYSPILELGDDPHPLTPREKVAAFKEELERRCLMLGDAEYLSTYRAAMNEAYLLAEKMFGLTALASGSGDHAELARDLRAFEGSDDLGNGDFTVCEFAADALDSLLAEIAALRETADVSRADRKMLSDMAVQNAARATEAERKLAEAVGLLNKMVAAFCGPLTRRALGGHDERQMEATLQTRTFLSKEAERG